MVLCEVCKVYSRADGIPYVSVELVWFNASQLTSGQLVGGYDEDYVLVGLCELLVETTSDLGTVSLKQTFGYMHVFFAEGVM